MSFWEQYSIAEKFEEGNKVDDIVSHLLSIEYKLSKAGITLQSYMVLRQALQDQRKYIKELEAELEALADYHL